MSWFRSVLAVLVCTPLAAADEWPQWLGPRRDGGTAEKVAPWKQAPKALWRRPAGEGYSVPVVAGGRVFVHARVADREEEELTALDANTGKTLWRETYPRAPYKSVLNTGPQATPAVAGNRVYSFGITGVLSCHRADTGKRLWQVDAYKKLKADLPRFGVCCSPLVVGTRVLVSVGGKGSSVVAFDSETGEIQWQAFDDPASTASPVLFAKEKGRGGLPDAVFMTSLRLLAVNPLDGSLSWEYPLVFQPSGASPTPVVASDRLVASTISNGSAAVRVTLKEDKPVAGLLWQDTEMKGYFSTGVAAGNEHLYLVTNTLEPIPAAALRCVELGTGKERWKKDRAGYFHAGLIRTGDGKLLVLDDLGVLKLIDADTKAYRELCRAKVCGGTFVNPALAGGRAYVRDGKEVICLQLAP
jgi:outer membrane protein assembly factor BamB